MTVTHVLLVEDEVEARGALARALERAGFEVTACEGADAAVAALSRRTPDVAVIDLVLGADERGGLHVLEALRATSTSVPAIIVTAFADVDKVVAALNLGASRLIEKPFRATELLSVLERVLSARPDVTASVAKIFERAGLTPREAEVARFALKGLPSPEIANALGMSEKTVRQHLSRVYDKTGVSGRGELFHLVFPL